MTVGQKSNLGERALAAVAHGSILIGLISGGIAGILIALIIWLLQRNRSSYVADQSLQALAYQAIVYFGLWIIWILWGMYWLAMVMLPLFIELQTYAVTAPAGLWVGLYLMMLPTALTALAALYGVVAALVCLTGHRFQYLLVGRLVEAYG